VPDGGMEMDFEVSVPAFALQVGGLALGVSYGAVVQQTFGRGLVDLLLNGYGEGRTDYAIGNTIGSYATYLDVALGYGRNLGPVSLGVVGHYLHGRTLSRSRFFEPRYNGDGYAVQLDYMEVLARGGKGFAIDVGAAYQPVPRLTLGAAVGNAIGGMWWSPDLLVRDLALDEDSFGGGITELLERFTDSERPLRPEQETLRSAELADQLYPGATLPATLRMGGAFAPWAGARLGAAYHHEVTTRRLGGGWNRSVQVGAQQKLAFLALRAGYSVNPGHSAMWTAGGSLGPIDVGVGRLSGHSAAAPRSGWRANVGLSVRGRIRKTPATIAAPAGAETLP
jgi:hypothetical protein